MLNSLNKIKKKVSHLTVDKAIDIDVYKQQKYNNKKSICCIYALLYT